MAFVEVESTVDKEVETSAVGVGDDSKSLAWWNHTILKADDDEAIWALCSTNRMCQDNLKALLKTPKAPEAFEILCDGQARTKDYISKKLGYSCERVHSAFYAIQELQEMKVIEKAGTYERKTLWRLVDRFFPTGRPHPLEGSDEYHALVAAAADFAISLVMPPKTKIKKAPKRRMVDDVVKKTSVNAEDLTTEDNKPMKKRKKKITRGKLKDDHPHETSKLF